MTIQSMANLSVLITGASSGIGKAFAVHLAKKCSCLVLISNHLNKLLNIKAELENESTANILVFPCDLSKLNCADKIKGFLDENNIQPEIFINNAGDGVYGKFSETAIHSQTNIINLNVAAVTSITKLALDIMMQTGKGAILNVSSTMAFRPGPNWAVYAATKSYIFSFTKSLSIELEGTGIHAAVLCPGKTKTMFNRRAGGPASESTKGASPESVAAYAIEQLSKGKQIIIPGLKNRMKYFLFKILPASVINILVIRNSKEH